jgi:hypothetical protein
MKETIDEIKPFQSGFGLDKKYLHAVIKRLTKFVMN